MIKLFIEGFKINALFTIFSRITGFVRDIAFAYYLGAGVHSDIFFISSKLPNVFRRITAEGALTSSFLPVYSGILNDKDKHLAQEYSKLIFTTLLIFVISLTLFLEIFMEEVVILIAPGFYNDKILLEKIVVLSRFTVLFLPIISIVALFGSMLNAAGKFGPFAFIPIILNSTLIVACITITDNLDIKSFPLAIGLPIAGFIQLGFIYFYLLKFKLINKNFINLFVIKRATFIKHSKNLKLTLSRFFPALLGGGVYQINILVDTLLASIVGVGAVSFLYYSDRIIQLPIGIVGVALGIALLSSLSRPKVLKSITQTSIQFEKAIKISIYFSIPSMFVLIFFPEIIINSIFQRGYFDIFASKQTILSLICYSFGIPFFIISKSCQSLFLASGATKKIMLIAIFQLIINILFSLILMRHLSHGGIALATSIATFLGCILYFKLIIKEKKIRLGRFKSSKKIGFIYLLKYTFNIVLLSLLMVIFLNFILQILNFFDINLNLIYLFIFTLLGLCFYLLITYFANQVPIDLYKKSIKGDA